MGDLNFFRDQYKHPDQYPMSHKEKQELSEEINNDKEQRQKGAAEAGSLAATERMHTPLTENFQKVIDNISGFRLKDDFKNDKTEADILENRKKIILGFLHNVVDDVNNYVNHINNTLNQKEDLREGEAYRAIMGRSDEARRNYHNRLISDLKLAIRQININFNKDFPEKSRVEEEKRYKEREGMNDQEIKKALDKRDYVSFPNKLGVLLDFREVPKDPQGEREYIMRWAFDFYADLAALAEEIENEIKK